MNKKIIVILSVLAIIVFAGAVIISVNKNSNSVPVATNTGSTTPTGSSSTSTPTTGGTATTTPNVKTYNNTTHAFSFQYPATYRDTTAERSSNIPLLSLEKGETAIAIKRIVPTASQTYEKALINDVILDPKGDHPESFKEFTSRTINGKQFHWIVTSRFEGLITINYYLKRDKDILVFSTQNRNVPEWTNPAYVIDDEPVHKDLRGMLATLKSATAADTTLEISLFYVNTTSPDFNVSCAATGKVTRIIPKTVATADAALKELFKGPTATEKSQGLISSFDKPLEGSTQDPKPLRDHYIGVTVKNGKATVNFKPDGMTYLNSTACMQESVKTSIEKTLKQFSSITEVVYAINGKVVTDWDA
ncbi:MAG: GerMN domain-containing protein [Patescibacteria group bacterium]